MLGMLGARTAVVIRCEKSTHLVVERRAGFAAGGSAPMGLLDPLGSQIVPHFEQPRWRLKRRRPCESC